MPEKECGSETKTDELATALEADLVRLHGVILTGEPLSRVLGYSSRDAMRQAASRGKLPSPVFLLENRKGYFALAKDVARWLAEQRAVGRS